MKTLSVQTKKFWMSAKTSTNAFIVQTSVLKMNWQIVSSSVRKQRKKLNLTEQKGCEGLLNKAECPKALKDMECNKTPGSDGLPAEFYKVFWNDISDLFLNSINYAYRIGQLSVTQRRGILKLIPKKKDFLTAITK